ncbi:AzlD domain-containing protein [Paenibacillus polymyxa]|uniref:Branched-chain amino acid transport protein AzlD n=1 Tax=Paenibacillus polymyxa TaxID=1406 RepID=A0A378XWB0_PAEPO|nr:AzlD domain-containing protein [Paenibacillus polymyxa]MBE7897110.1 AzlD domain-containing protein [Paenibacillus polymyxa]MBG9762968.1 branched-chain amino acid transporter AzlD [Paenibacillus polymyxa]MCC3257642.1 AzlD domain-containing protein [Paenibacillus polymyxa]QPK51279.1 AzlD domain-containing protein [Paenibacillus polymyxa]QPK56372.1 AzlD domain-containing protein [Paenibacillus polymyxa]
MNISPNVLYIIIGGMIVTAIPRIIPFVVLQKLTLPKPVLQWLSYIPICIFTALVMENMLVRTETSVTLNGQVLIAVLPTLVTALWSKNLLATVVVGIVSMAVVRLLWLG